jgi:tetratricopeptide (TPR) repeat protein
MPPRFACIPFDNVRKTTKSGLRAIVQSIITDSLSAREQAKILRDHHFSHFGQSAAMVMDLLEAEIEGRDMPWPSVSPSNAVLDADFLTYHEAEALLQQGDEPAAMRLLQRLVSNGTALWQPYNDLAAMTFAKGNTTLAFELIKQAVDKEGRIGTAIRNMAQMYQVSGAADEAAILCAEILRNSPADEDIKLQLAALLSKNGQNFMNLNTCQVVIETLLSK